MLLMQTTFQRNQQVAQFHDRHKEQRFFIARFFNFQRQCNEIITLANNTGINTLDAYGHVGSP